MIEEIRKFAGEYRVRNIVKTHGTEGYGFTATILRNGKVIGKVVDYATGAPAEIESITDSERSDLEVYAKTKYPRYANSTIVSCGWIFLNQLVNYTQSAKAFKSDAKKHPLFSDTELDEHGVPTAIRHFTCAYNEKIVEDIKKLRPDVVLINELILAGI